jgi:uncharacterized membrane protein YfcA
MTAFALGQVAGLAVALAAAGACTGFLAGVFGVGGGTIIVPVLYEVFGLYGVPEEVRMPMCVGTSLAVIIPTSITSFLAHYKKGSVDVAVLRAWVIPIVAGVIIGIVAASFARPVLFKVVFIVVSLFLAIRFLTGKDSWRLRDRLPAAGAMAGYGLAIGASSSLMGIGGGLVANIVLSLFGKPIHAAVATASGVGVIVSIPGAIGYVIAGWPRDDLPPLSLGFVSVIGCELLISLSLATVRHGVSLAHRLRRRQLEIALAAYLVLVSLRFVVTL